MKNILTIKNLNFSYLDQFLLEDINLNLVSGSWNTIIGPSGVGKTTLLHIIIGLLECDGSIVLDNTNFKEDKEEYLKKIGVVFENPNLNFTHNTVYDNFFFPLENLDYSKKDAIKRIQEVAELLEIKPLLHRNIHSLSGGEKQFVSLALAIVHKPKLLILDEAFTMIDSFERKKLLDKIKKIQKKEKMTILQVTHDMEECLYSDTLFVLYDRKIIAHGKKEKIIKDEKLFTKIGLELPFLVSLSKKLQYYDLIAEDYYNMEQLVDAIWK